MYDFIIVGAGFAGTVLAERIATQLDKKVLVIEKRDHIGGNCYDFVNTIGIRIHKYGPHLFHTDSKEVYDYLSQFTAWNKYIHEVVAFVDGENIPIPFNLNTLYKVFNHTQAKEIESKLLKHYGKAQKIPILELMKEEDSELKALGQYIYDKIFVNYTAKQWGKRPDEIDSSVTARVPVLTSRDNRYFTDKYQVVPEHGYTQLFQNMLKHKNITVMLNTDALDIIKIDDKTIYFQDEIFHGKVIYTGMIDELFQDKYGLLPYRSLDLKFELHDKIFFQNHAVVNYPNDYDFTRITEFKHIYPATTSKTTILKEYPTPYIRDKNIPYYPLFTSENQKKYDKYALYSEWIPNLILLGRLAEYKYYDMDDIVECALKVFKDKVCI